MSDYELYSLVVSPDVLTDALIGLAQSPRPLTIDDLSTVIDKSETYTRAVALLGEQLSVIDQHAAGYVVVNEIQEEARKMTPEQGFAVLNRYVQRYEPFMAFLNFLADGYDTERSAQTVVTLFQIDASAETVEGQFIKLGRYTDLVTEEDEPQPTIEVKTLPSAYIDDLQEAATSEAKARLFVHERLGEEIISFADPESIEKLQGAMMKFSNAPENAIVDAVVAAENITRELAEEHGTDDVDYSNASGIGTLAKALRRDELILKRHLHGAHYLGGMRIPGAHGKEAETLESWQVDLEVALEVILATISYVRSLYWYILDQRQVL